ncbi:MAG: alpha/beta hydrolase [Bacteroidetes bacterium]|nr:alpha/beta hydrolase [Bacteroidota bacterium]
MQEERYAEEPNPSILHSPQYEFKFLRQLGLAFSGGSTFGECYAIGQKMQAWDPARWVLEWAALATDIEQQGEQSAEHGHEISARESYLRASTYYHAAEYYGLIANTDFVQYGRKTEESFAKAMSLMPYHWEAVEVEANGKSYPCHFLSPDTSRKPRKTVLVVPGIESCAEEQFFYVGVGALQRGYNVFVFQGPGQAGSMRRDPECHLRNDFEVPLQVALDYLCSRPEIDTGKLAVMGNGLGGYFSARMAVFDRRIQALIMNPPFINLQRVLLALIGSRARNIDFSVDDVRDLPTTILQNDMKLFVLNMCRRFGISRLQELITSMQSYTIEDMIYRITCPSLILRGEVAYAELESQAMFFYEHIQSTDKTRVSVPALHVADSHDHVGNIAYLNQIVFDWLDERF